MAVEKNVEQVRALFLSTYCEQKLVSRGEEILRELRSKWKKERASFTSDIVAELKTYSEAIEAIKDFELEKEDFNYLRSKEDIDDVIANVFQILDKLASFPVSKKIAKDVRDLELKRQTLPNSDERVVERKKSEAERTLKSNPPQCKKCGQNMMLREGNGSYFWGCRDFPTCWGKKYLTKDELAIIA